MTITQRKRLLNKQIKDYSNELAQGMLKQLSDDEFSRYADQIRRAIDEIHDLTTQEFEAGPRTYTKNALKAIDKMGYKEAVNAGKVTTKKLDLMAHVPCENRRAPK